MTTFYVCGVRDRAVDGFGSPIFVVSTGVAMRSFADEINKVDSPWHAHPDDFDLYLLALFDDETGKFRDVETKMLSVGKQVFVS